MWRASLLWGFLAVCFAASSISDAAAQSTWEHNGSTFEIISNGTNVVIRYLDPRAGMRDEGVVPGTVLMYGTVADGHFSGVGRVFSGRCGRAYEYEFTGIFSNDGRRIEVTGTVPSKIDRNCNVTGTRTDNGLFAHVAGPLPPMVANWVARLNAPSRESGAARIDSGPTLEDIAVERERRRAAEVREQALREELAAAKAIAAAERERADNIRRNSVVTGKPTAEMPAPTKKPPEAQAPPISVQSYHSYEWIALCLFVVGAFYLVGQLLKDKADKHPIRVRIFVGVTVAVLAAIVLRALGLEDGVKLATITIGGILVISFALFAAG